MPVVGNRVRVVRPDDSDWAPHTLWRARVGQTGVVVADHGRWIHVKHEDGSVIAWRDDELTVLWSFGSGESDGEEAVGAADAAPNSEPGGTTD